MIDQVQLRYPSIDILLCVESGSRMWGFASPDSDFDIRFIYKQKKPSRYLELNDPQETIEFSIPDLNYDYSGWDLKKALRLAYKSNVSLHEWLASPIIYSDASSVSTKLRVYADSHFSLREMSHHYLGLATSTFKQHLSGTGEKTLKKFFYAIRPILAIEYMKTFGKLPPVKLAELVYYFSYADLYFRNAINDLIMLKTTQPEVQTAPAYLEAYFTEWLMDKFVMLDHDFINNQIKSRAPDAQALNEIFQSGIKEDCGVESWKACG